MAASFPISSSSSRQSLSPLSRGSSRPLMSDVFKPRLPLDPFVAVPEKWCLKVDNVISAMNAHNRRDVLLVLGAPSLRDLEPLFHSQHLQSSLLILATHRPPNIHPSSTFPAVRILRLSTPLAIEDAGAIRFVNVLECAERVARIWRKTGGEGIEELSEAELDAGGLGSLSPPNVFRLASPGSANSSPGSSTERLNPGRLTPPPRRRLLSASSSTTSINKARKLPPVDSSQRPFDCVFNFLSADVSDKALLKQSILVTTISRPFLTAASKPTRPATARSSSRISVVGASTEDGRRWSGILNRNSIYSAPTTPSTNRSHSSLYSSPGLQAFPLPATPRRAHIVHLIPPAPPSVSRNRLLESIESFLCSFAYSSSLENGQADMERAVPFLMNPPALRSIVRYAPPSLSPSSSPSKNISSEWTIADLLLSGALDRAAGAGETEKLPPRGWISGANDITFVPSSRPGSVKSVSMAQAIAPVPSPSAPIPSPSVPVLSPSVSVPSPSPSAPVLTSIAPIPTPVTPIPVTLIPTLVTPIIPPMIPEHQRVSSWNAAADDLGMGRDLTRYESWSGAREMSTLTAGESGVLKPNLTLLPTPEMILHLPVGAAAPMFPSYLQPISGEKALPTPPGSEESGSSVSTPYATLTTKLRPKSKFVGKKLVKEERTINQGKSWGSKWKFWKVPATTASA